MGENKEFARQFLGGDLEVELVPQGTLAERFGPAAPGIPGFYTAAGVGTQVRRGGLPWRYSAAGRPGRLPAEGQQGVRRATYVLEAAIRTDFALVRAAVADRMGTSCSGARR